jgi:hypothetical membrane protein
VKEKIYALLGFIASLVAYLSISISIYLSPWFSWEKNALSDLGHSLKSTVAPIFNLGLSLASFLIMIHVFTSFREHAKYTAVGLIVSSLFLQLIATFDEVYGLLHGVVSVLFFLSLGISSLLYAYEKKSFFAVIMFIIGLCSWIIYGLEVFSLGIAVPETISSVTIMLLLLSSTFKIFFKK